MRESDFWLLATEVFGATYAKSLMRELHLSALEDQTAVAALEKGMEPRKVWHAVCDAMNLDDRERWGKDLRRMAPPAGR